MGLLGAMGGAGQGLADIGKMGVANALDTERQAAHDASEEARMKRIEEWKSEAELKRLDDPRYIAARKRQSELDAAKAGATAEAQENAKVRAKNSPDAIAAEERAHKRKLGEISAEADAKAKAEKEKGGWTPKDAEKEIRASVAQGMGIDAAGFTNFGEQTEKRYNSLVSEAVKIWEKDPSMSPAAAVDIARKGNYAEMESSALEASREKEVRKEVNKEANKGILGMGGQDFGPEGREAWIEREVQKRLQKPSAAPQNNGGTMPAGIPPGSKQIGTSGGKPVYEAPNGKRYIVE